MRSFKEACDVDVVEKWGNIRRIDGERGISATKRTPVCIPA